MHPWSAGIKSLLVKSASYCIRASFFFLQSAVFVPALLMRRLNHVVCLCKSCTSKQAFPVCTVRVRTSYLHQGV